MTVERPLYICTEYEKKTETDYSYLIGKTQDMWEWYKAVGLVVWAVEHGVHNYTRKQKIKLLKEKTGICLSLIIDGQQTF